MIRAALITFVFAVFALAAGATASPARAEDASPLALEGRATIQKQLDAFDHDDIAAAYALASPGIQGMFSSPETFFDMVKLKYPPVYRRRSTEFGASAVDGENLSQIVTIVDNDNVVWKAVYKFERSPSGALVISGCVLIKSTDAAT